MRVLTSRASLAPDARAQRQRSRWWHSTTHGATPTATPTPTPSAATLGDWPARMILLGLLIPVAFGRWGSYISPAGGLVYLSDLLVAGGLVFAALEALRVHRRVRRPSARSLPWLAAGVLAVLAIGLVRAGTDTMLVVRDMVPVLYLALIPVAAWAVRRIGVGTAYAWVRTALALHTAWMLPAILGVLPAVSVPLVGVPLFDTRLDFDMLLCGAAIAAFALDHRPRPAVRAAVIGASLLVLALAGSRAGLLSALAVLAVAAAVARPFRGARREALWVGLGLAALAPVIVSIPALLASPPSWARALVRLIPSDDAAYGSALNTWDARVDAWELLLDYTREDPWRWLFGSGFGSSPVLDSGAIAHLSGDPSVRAAHSFLVTWIAYVGVVGAAILLGLVLALLAMGVANARRRSAPVALGLGLMVGIVLAAVPGVIFESPFGYQTFIVASAFALLAPGDLRGRRGLGDAPGAGRLDAPPRASSRWRRDTTSGAVRAPDRGRDG